MEKGKSKSEKKYISVVVIPHCSDSIKTLKISGPYSKALIMGLFVLLFLSLASASSIKALNENAQLKKDMRKLHSMNADQQKLLKRQSEQIQSLTDKEDYINSKIEDFTNKYKEMADDYIQNRPGEIKTNRSGNASLRSVSGGLGELKSLIEDLNNINAGNSRLFREITETENKLNEYIYTIPTLWPAEGKITSGFGNRSDPFTRRQSFHDGIDIAAPYGNAILASAAGEVILAEKINIYGYTAIIDHGNGIETFYGHTSKLLVKKGQRVKKGDVIARMGNSGRSTGTHLHFKVTLGGTPVNPIDYLDER
ncbi:murein DD-endopeptidase MepM/ murein hydrolase activator NlpD [Anaerobacterium chartisolvens]|uniref:Murein DD-endopeptidase MepM/ murein hydrolase activator NlpD n=1 Tax=Anaerobacterium chartisolvens TaxID=1297424 RepID=A0A369B7G9_9FIRM|nr:M23 family metallopeptidase [Anaerobacterium chartisolvens]RCX17463.1 murein DD-endopeptidase MepM/ murein hydrolase activator NlpD [Anaerobacterium chartisolvens]